MVVLHADDPIALHNYSMFTTDNFKTPSSFKKTKQTKIKVLLHKEQEGRCVAQLHPYILIVSDHTTDLLIADVF